MGNPAAESRAYAEQPTERLNNGLVRRTNIQQRRIMAAMAPLWKTAAAYWRSDPLNIKALYVIYPAKHISGASIAEDLNMQSVFMGRTAGLTAVMGSSPSAMAARRCASGMPFHWI